MSSVFGSILMLSFCSRGKDKKEDDLFEVFPLSRWKDACIMIVNMYTECSGLCVFFDIFLLFDNSATLAVNALFLVHVSKIESFQNSLPKVNTPQEALGPSSF